jgi:thiol-disulfide isomerase/thioredoxin
MNRLWIVWMGLGVAAWLTGCGKSTPSVPDAQAAADNAPAGSSFQVAGKVSLVVGDAAKLREMIAQHKGKVVLVDCWATWCGPCVQAFPHTVEMANKYRDQGLATIAVSFDELADQPRVVDFLERHGAWFDNLLSKHDGVSQAAAHDFEVEALPQYRLYDRQGRLRHRWEGASDELERRIVELLAERG